MHFVFCTHIWATCSRTDILLQMISLKLVQCQTFPGLIYNVGAEIAPCIWNFPHLLTNLQSRSVKFVYFLGFGLKHLDLACRSVCQKVCLQNKICYEPALSSKQDLLSMRGVDIRVSWNFPNVKNIKRELTRAVYMCNEPAEKFSEFSQ